MYVYKNKNYDCHNVRLIFLERYIELLSPGKAWTCLCLCTGVKECSPITGQLYIITSVQYKQKRRETANK